MLASALRPRRLAWP